MRVERLDHEHDLEGFRCGNPSIDRWLRTHALENQRRNLSRTFVIVDEGKQVIGFYALTMGSVVASALPRRFGRGLPNVQVGMVLIARLAVSTQAQGKGIGRDVLLDAIGRAVLAGQHAAARFIAVDPVDYVARTFYSHFGFVDIPGDERGRMYLRLPDASASLTAAGRP